MKVSDMMQEKTEPRASDVAGEEPSDKKAKARYTDYVIEKQTNGETPLRFEEWYPLHQQGKL